MQTILRATLVIMLAFGLFAAPERDAHATEKSTLTIMVFAADWCGVCRALDPTLERAVEDAGDAVELIEIDVDEQPELPSQYGVYMVPVVLAIKDGETVDYFNGNMSYDEIVEFIENALSV